MPDTSTTVPSQRQTLAALSVGSVALLIPGLQPLLLGELVAQQRITLTGVGLVAMGEIITLGLGVIAGNAFLSPARLPAITRVTAVLLSLLDLLTVRLNGDVAFAATRALAGLLEGILVWVTTSVIVRTAIPDRLAAIFLASQTLAQAAVAALLASVVIPSSGWPGGFVVLAVLSAALAALTPALRPGLRPLQSQDSKIGRAHV